MKEKIESLLIPVSLICLLILFVGYTVFIGIAFGPAYSLYSHENKKYSAKILRLQKMDISPFNSWWFIVEDSKGRHVFGEYSRELKFAKSGEFSSADRSVVAIKGERRDGGKPIWIGAKDWKTGEIIQADFSLVPCSGSEDSCKRQAKIDERSISETHRKIATLLHSRGGLGQEITYENIKDISPSEAERLVPGSSK